MRTAFGPLAWKPAEFWSATMTEFFEAIEGWNDANGVHKDDAPTNAELDMLTKKYG